MEEFVHFFLFLLLKSTRTTYFYTNVLIIFSSTFKLLSTWFLESMAMKFFFLFSLFVFLRFNSGCNFHHFSSVKLSMLHWLQWLLGYSHLCAVVVIFLSFHPFYFFFPSLESSCFSFCFDSLDCASFKPMFSRYCAYTQVLSTNLGLININFSHRWQCRPPKYLRSASRFFGGYPTLLPSFLTFWCTPASFAPNFS